MLHSPARRWLHLKPWRRGGGVCVCGLVGAAVLALALFAVFSSWPPPPRAMVGSPEALVELTLLTGAREKGTLCLDGSPPGYHLQRGFGSGSENWLLHLQGGAWCNTVESCSERKMTDLGSSRYMEAIEFVGIFSNETVKNPDFYNWNKVYIRYCDGASFSGDVEDEFRNGTELFFRGLRIWEAVIGELLAKGLANAKQAFLTGCSAGGLATLLHCDDFRARVPQEVPAKDIPGKRTIRSSYDGVVHLQNVGKVLPKDCLARMEPTQCFFPAELIKSISTPMFVLNSGYDSWQIQHVLAPEKSDPRQSWLSCKTDIQNCDSAQIEVLNGFRKTLIDALKVVQDNRDLGMFINSCFTHCQTTYQTSWNSPVSPRLSSKTVAEAVGDWYSGRSEVKQIDCECPCNPTCSSMCCLLNLGLHQDLSSSIHQSTLNISIVQNHINKLIHKIKIKNYVLLPCNLLYCSSKI